MANYHTMYSVVIPTGCGKQRRFISEVLDDSAMSQGLEGLEDLGIELEKMKYEEDLWAHSDSGGQYELIDAVAQWQLKFNKTEPWYISWADVCSKPRLDSFGGSAAVCYRGRVKVCLPVQTLEDWVSENF